MLIYKDIFSDDELCSDTFPVKVVDDVILEFTGKFVERKEGDIQIAGFNPSGDPEGGEPEEGVDEHVQKGVDIVLNHQLVEMPIYQNAAIFKDWVKEYMKKLVDRMTADGKSADDVKQFKTKMQKWVAGLLSKDRFKNLNFYQGSSDNAAEGQLAILEFRENDIPIVMLVRPGLVEEKC